MDRLNRPSSDPSTNVPLNPPDVPVEDKQRQLEGDRPVEDQAAYIDISDTEDVRSLTPTEIDEGDLETGSDDDMLEGDEQLDVLAELELRDGETDDPMVAVEEGFTYVPPTDPPTVPSDNYDGAEVASGFGGSSLEDPYNADNHSSFDPSDDDVAASVREALLADSSTSAYAHRIAVAVKGNIVILRGVVDDLTDSDNLLAVAGYVEGVEDVVDELTIRGLE